MTLMPSSTRLGSWTTGGSSSQSAPSHSHPNRLPHARKRVRHLRFPLMASRMQVPPNSDLTLGMVCVDKSVPGALHLEDAGGRALRQSGRDHARGFLGAFADSSMGRPPSPSSQGREVFCSNAEMKISFLAPVHPGSELKCTAEVVSGGRRVAFVEASVTARLPGHGDRRAPRRPCTSTYIYKDRD